MRALTFSEIEQADLLKAWLATSLAFAIFFIRTGTTPLGSLSFSSFLVIVGLAAVTAGVGFVGHELMHKVTSFRFGVHAEFRSNDQMLVLSILIAFLGVIFAAPGAVHIWGHVSRRENGIISAAGPAANMVLALLFLPLVFATAPLLHLIGTIGLLVNALLGLFNLIPLWGFDGSKVLAWNKPVYFVMVVLGAVLVVFSYSTVYA